MKVKWQSDTPNMELKVPKGQYLPYELPVATKEVLGGVKVDGDTINITSDGVISAQKVDLSGVATKVELEEVENKIPDTSGLATKIELATVESKIPDTSGLATKIELTAVENKIPDVSGFATKDEIPNVSGLATKVELSNVEAKIPTTYLKSATVNNNKLTIINADDTSIEFSGGGSGGGGSSGSSIPVYSFTSGQELTAEEKGQLDIIKNNPKSVIVYIDGLKANNIYSVSNTIAFTVGGDANIDVKIYTNTDYISYKPQHGGLYLYSFYNTTIYDTVLGKNVKVNNTKITKVRSSDFIVTDINSSGSYSSLDEDFIVDWIHNPNQYNVTVDDKPVIYVKNDKNSTSVSIYTLTPDYGSLVLSGTSFNFSDNKKLAFDSNSTQYYAMADKTLLDSQNWQNYISLGGQSDWTYTSSISDSSLYNATELIIYWHKDYQNYYCNYYKFDQDNGSTLGGNYQWQTFNAYDHTDGSGTSSWNYDGTSINTSNMDILGLYYKA